MKKMISLLTSLVLLLCAFFKNGLWMLDIDSLSLREQPGKACQKTALLLNE